MWASQAALTVQNLMPMQEIRDAGSIPGLGGSPGGRHGSPLQCSCLENPMDKGARRATVHRVAQSWTQLKWLSKHTRINSVYTYVSSNLPIHPTTLKYKFCCEATSSILLSVYCGVTLVLEWATCCQIRSFFKEWVALEVISKNLWWMYSDTISKDFWSFFCLLGLKSCPTCIKDLQMLLWPQDWSGDWLLSSLFH